MSERIEDALSQVQKAYSARPRTALDGLSEYPAMGENPVIGEADGATATALPIRGVVLVNAELNVPAVSQAVIANISGWSGALPEPGEAQTREQTTLLRRAADDLLVLTSYDDSHALAGAVATALGEAAPDRAALVEVVSDGYALMRLSGSSAREVLAKGAAIDMHPAAFGPGALRIAALGAVETALFIPSGVDQGDESIDLLCARSHAAALYGWLRRAGAAGVAPKAIAASPKIVASR